MEQFSSDSLVSLLCYGAKGRGAFNAGNVVGRPVSGDYGTALAGSAFQSSTRRTNEDLLNILNEALHNATDEYLRSEVSSSSSSNVSPCQ